MTLPNDPTVARTPAPGCPACEARRRHTADEWKLYHPQAGQGRADAAAGGKS